MYFMFEYNFLEYTNIDPYWLGVETSISLCFMFQLSSYQTEHVLTAPQEPFPGSIIDISLYMTCISSVAEHLEFCPYLSFVKTF